VQDAEQFVLYPPAGYLPFYTGVNIWLEVGALLLLSKRKYNSTEKVEAINRVLVPTLVLIA
jgi:hypothetical protein